MTRCVSAVLVYVVCCLAVSPTDALGQNQRETLKAAGTVHGYGGGLLYVMTNKGDQYRVKLPTRPEYISYIGSATPSFLAPGMLVKFTAKFDNKGRAATPLREITVFTPGKEDKIGVYPDAGLGGGAKDLFSDADSRSPEPQGQSYRVAGSIASIRGGRLTVAAGRTAVQVEIDEKARVSVEVSHLQFMQAGDNVSLDGWYYPVQKRDVVANRITISAAETLGAPKKPVAEE